MSSARFKKEWAAFKSSRPGNRFREHYERRKKSPHSLWARLVEFGLAVILIALGLFFAVAPGPASIFFFAGGGLLAAESLVIARLMDWVEVKCRAVVAWGKRHWRRLPRSGKALVIVVVAAGSAACALAAYLFMFR